MAAYVQGYDEERFVTTVNRNFICLICFNVLRDPVLCPRNQHCFCRGCITKHLENSRRCPTCNDGLTEDTLAEPPRMVKDILDELIIHCSYKNRGCQETVQLQYLDRHEGACGFKPIVCTNQGCNSTLNKRDLVHHESEVCKFRKLKCHSCDEMSKTLQDMEKRMSKIESNMEINTANMEGKLDAVSTDVRELQTALIDAFNETKDVLVKFDDESEESPRKRRRTTRGRKENIIVAGGIGTNTVEIFNLRQRTWLPLQSMPEKRHGATSFVHNNQVVIAGGFESGCLDNTIKMNVGSCPDLSEHWSNCLVKLPAKLAYHSSVLYKDHLIVTGGSDGNATSDCIHDVQLVPPYTVKTLSRMTERRRNHCTEIFDDSLLIVGGSTSGNYQDNLNNVVLYDIKKNECKQLSPLPYEVSQMATVHWGDNVVVIGGIDKRGHVLDTVVIYNVKTEQSHMLPPMRCKRWQCTAVIVQDNIVVLGGAGSQWQALKLTEAFNFERYTWEQLPDMFHERFLPTAVAV